VHLDASIGCGYLYDVMYKLCISVYEFVEFVLVSGLLVFWARGGHLVI